MNRSNRKLQALVALSLSLAVSFATAAVGPGDPGGITQPPALLNVAPQIAAGYDFSLALKDDGTVWSWGSNEYGQLGIGKPNPPHGYVTMPVQVKGVPMMKAIAAGGGHSVALGADGTVWTWGANKYGQLGPQTSTVGTPSQVPGLDRVVAVAAGDQHTMVLKDDGSVWTWGRDPLYNEIRPIPVQVPGISGATGVAAGLASRAVAMGDGSAWLWGEIPAGNGTSATPWTPAHLIYPVGVSGGALGGGHAIVFRNVDGHVWTWGQNNAGQLGIGSYSNTILPQLVSGLIDVKAVSAGHLHSVAVKTDGTVWSWGDNQQGQLGNGTPTYGCNVPVQIASLSGIRAVSAGWGHTLALKSDDWVWAWGDNTLGQLGVGSTPDTKSKYTTPVRSVIKLHVNRWVF